MFCKNCGNELPENAKFCKKCGKEVNKKINLQEDSFGDLNGANTDKENIENSKGKKDKKNKRKRTVGRIILKIILLLIMLMAIVILLDYLGVIQFSFDTSNENEVSKEKIEELVDFNVDDVQIEHPNADSYYEQNAELIATFSVTQSEDVQTEKSIENILKERGFIDYPIWSEYTIDGDYYTASETSGSEEKHPMYQTYYVSSNNEVWTIIVVNGSVMANPVSYNMQSDLGVQILFAESEVITSYDSVTNKFYESIPNESELIVKVVEKIDAATLEKLSIEVIEEYE